MSRLCLYYRKEPDADRWITGDRFVRSVGRRLLRGQPRVGGIDKVVLNLQLGLDRLGMTYYANVPFQDLRNDDRVCVLGRGPRCLDGYDRRNPIVAGIGLMTHPSEWPTLCDDYPVVRYLQHSEWAANVYRPYYGERVQLWPVGIDTQKWTPAPRLSQRHDFLIYDKIHWDRETTGAELLGRVREALQQRQLSWTELRYGTYDESEFKTRLDQTRAMIFLSEHESQGIAYQECLASGVPILAWDQGRCLDPCRFEWGQPDIPTSSVPFFDERCGARFDRPEAFPQALDEFLERLQAGVYLPREFVLDNLTLERCSANLVRIVNDATGLQAA